MTLPFLTTHPPLHRRLAALEPRLWRVAQFQHDAGQWRRALYRWRQAGAAARSSWTLENLRLKTGTLSLQRAAGLFERLRDEMKSDADLRQRYFENLDMLFYAGAIVAARSLGGS